MSPVIALAVLTGVLGLAVGSFLNVVIHRVPARLSVVSPPSRCPSCETPIKGRHNVPVVGWLVLRGRCAGCAEQISARYPIVEAATGALFVALTLRLGPTPALPAYLYLAAVGVALAMIALDTRWLPDSIVLPSYAVAIALLLPVAAARGDWDDAWHGLLGLTGFVALTGLMALAPRLGLGTGEVKLAGLVGLFVGFLSLPALLVAAGGTLLALGLVGAVLLARRRLPSVGGLSAGPCLLGAAALALFVTTPLVSLYSTVAST